MIKITFTTDNKVFKHEVFTVEEAQAIIRNELVAHDDFFSNFNPDIPVYLMQIENMEYEEVFVSDYWEFFMEILSIKFLGLEPFFDNKENNHPSTIDIKAHNNYEDAYSHALKLKRKQE